MDKKSKIIFSGIWSYPIGLLFFYSIFNGWSSLIGKDLTIWGHIIVWILALIFPLIVFLRNGWDYVFCKKRRYTLKNQIIKDPTEYTTEKVRSMYPPVPGKYLSMTPEGFILGKQDFRYFRIPMRSDNILHGCIIGAPGSGKSAGPYLCTLQANFMQEVPPMTVFVIDIKPELAKKSVELYANPSARIINPTDRSSWGWDVYYQLSDDSTDDDVLHVLDGISRALISSSNPKDAFFVNQAQTIFQGMCLYYYKKGYSFVDSVVEIVSNDLTTHIKNILNDKTGCPKGSKTYARLKKFADKSSDAFQDIELTLGEHLSVIATNSSAMWALRDNPLKATPLDLNEDISLYLSLPENVLDEYSDLFRLITFQVLQEMESRSEDSKPLALILDEFARIGKLEKIKDSLATLRSRKVSIWLAFQDMSQLESVYSKEDARTILNLCEVTCVLSCKDNQTAKTISEWAGEYRETHTSVSTPGVLSGDIRENSSQQYHKVLQPADVMTLKQTKEVLLFVEGEYYRIKRLRYFEDPILNKRYKQLIAINSEKED